MQGHNLVTDKVITLWGVVSFLTIVNIDKGCSTSTSHRSHLSSQAIHLHRECIEWRTTIVMVLVVPNIHYIYVLYWGFCNKYVIYHEHECDDYPPRDLYDCYPSDTPSIDWWVASLGYYCLVATATFPYLSDLHNGQNALQCSLLDKSSYFWFTSLLHFSMHKWWYSKRSF